MENKRKQEDIQEVEKKKSKYGASLPLIVLLT